jgi:uncharacterized protein YabN with tetrapyrrole methylase and pyrophosphatase domain
MKESFQELIDALVETRQKCPWVKEKLSIERLGEAIQSESEEITQAIDKKDMDNLKEEIGDLLMNVTHLAIICEEKGYFKAKDAITGVKEKLIRRKPWVFGDMKINTPEEAVRVWNEIKKKEKEGKK